MVKDKDVVIKYLKEQIEYLWQDWNEEHYSEGDIKVLHRFLKRILKDVGRRKYPVKYNLLVYKKIKELCKTKQ